MLVPLICKADDALMVGAVTDPVNVGLFRFDFKSRAVCAAFDHGFNRSVVFSTFSKPTIDFVIPVTVPVNAGLSNGAFRFN